MKIAIVITYFWPEQNGITRYISGLYSALKKNHPEVEIDVIAFDTMRTGIFKESNNDFKIYRIECSPMMHRTYAMPTFAGVKRVKKIFKENQYDVINIHTRFFFSSFMGLKMGKKFDIPVIHIEHGSGFVEHENFFIKNIAKIYDLTLGKYVLKNSDQVFGVSESVCRFAEKLGARKTEIIYNGIDLSFWSKKNNKREVVRKKYGIKEKEAAFVFVGRLVNSKGGINLIETLSIIDNIDWKLLIVGEGPEKYNLKKLVKERHLEEKILFIGSLKAQEIKEILQSSDLFINPSLASEGMPTTILEASASGCRAISSDKGGSVEILPEENIFKAGDNKSLKEKIINYDKIIPVDVSKFEWGTISKKFYDLIKNS